MNPLGHKTSDDAVAEPPDARSAVPGDRAVEQLYSIGPALFTHGSAAPHEAAVPREEGHGDGSDLDAAPRPAVASESASGSGWAPGFGPAATPAPPASHEHVLSHGSTSDLKSSVDQPSRTFAPGASSPPSAVVKLTGINRVFPGNPPVTAIRDVNLRIDRGEYLSIIGPSGSGKSTLLHLLGLLDRPTSGTYHLDGVDVATLTERRRCSLRGGRIGFVFQAFHLIPRRSVLDNVILSMLYQGVPRSERRARARETLEQVGLASRMDFLPTVLSGGERQRVAIARALAGSPALLLADEPTGNLDQANAMGVMELFDELHRAGLTLAVITHDDQISRRAQRRVRIADGEVSSS